MSWLSKQQLIQGHVSVKRPLSLIPHTTVVALDPALTGRSRFCRKYEGTYVVLVSDLVVTSSSGLVRNQNQFHVQGDNAKRLRNALLSVDGKEFVQVQDAVYNQLRNTADSDTLVTSVVAIQSSYAVGTKLQLLGFPVIVVGYAESGTTSMTFESTETLVAGDEFASFHYEAETPVLDNWQRIESVDDFTEYGDENNETYFRYHCTLSKPLQKQLDGISTVYVKAVPAYSSKKLPVDLEGSYHVDAFTGKVFGKGSDSLTLALTQYDENKTPFQTTTASKNSVICASAPNARDFCAWSVGDGTIQIQGNFTSTFNLDVDGRFCVGIRLLKQRVRFQIKFTFPTTTTSTVKDFDGTSAPSSYYVRLRTGYATTQYLYDTAAHSVIAISDAAPVPTTYAGVGSDFILDVDGESDMLVIEVSGPAGVSVPVQCFDQGTFVTSYTTVPEPVVHPRTRYLSYTYRADINTAEAWEGSCLLLKPVFPSLSELYTDTDKLVLDSGQVLS